MDRACKAMAAFISPRMGEILQTNLQMQSKMTDLQFDILLRIVNLARENQIERLETLHDFVVREGYPEEDVTEAVRFWARREKSLCGLQE